MTDEPRATLQIFTFKEGLLARLGHDLRLSLGAFDIACDGGKIEVHVDLNSLSVDGAVRDGVLESNELSLTDREKILASARHDVLEVGRYAEAHYSGKARQLDPGHFAIEGALALHGVTAPANLSVVLRGRELVAECILKPSQFGIKPFRALAGAIRVRDHARIVSTVPAPDARSADALLSLPLRFGAP